MCPPKKGEPGNLVQIIDQLRGLRFGAVLVAILVCVAAIASRFAGAGVILS